MEVWKFEERSENIKKVHNKNKITIYAKKISKF